MIAYTPTDICIEYIDKKDAYYLAKEGKIVYYASDSGRKSDFKWNTQTIVETCRIIRATMMGHEDVLAEKDLVRAFQEEGRVYEYGAKSRHVLASHVFNYNLKSDMSMTDEVVDAVVDCDRSWCIGLSTWSIGNMRGYGLSNWSIGNMRDYVGKSTG